MTAYTVAVEKLEVILPELEHMYRQHYAEMRSRLLALGVETAPYDPRWDTYFEYERAGHFLTFVGRLDGKAVGYANIYITSDMHNRELIASEDTLYVDPEHRGKSAGRDIVECVHATLKGLGVKRLNVTTATDLKVAAWLEKRGYKHTAHNMTICF